MSSITMLSLIFQKQGFPNSQQQGHVGGTNIASAAAAVPCDTGISRDHVQLLEQGQVPSKLLRFIRYA